MGVRPLIKEVFPLDHVSQGPVVDLDLLGQSTVAALLVIEGLLAAFHFILTVSEHILFQLDHILEAQLDFIARNPIHD